MARHLILSVLVCLTAGSFAMGQGGFGMIAGTVSEQTGGVIPGVEVTAVNIATGIKSSTISNDIGFYQIMQLLPGSYSLTVEFTGFKKLQRTGILLQVADRLTVNLVLEVGEVTDSINVSGDAPLLRTQDAQTGEVISSTVIRNLPQFNRDALALIRLAANVQGSGDRATPLSDTRINGGRTVGLDYIVDGITAGTGLGHGVVNTVPTSEAVGEFRVITNGISAEYGRVSGGAVELITKSGTNEYHGELFDYAENDAFNANTWDQNRLGGKKAHFTSHVFGGVVGGPIDIPKIYDGHNRTFFLFNFEGTRRRQAGTLVQGSVLTEEERKGDFSKTFFNTVKEMTLYDQNGPVAKDPQTGNWLRQQLLGNGKQMPDQLIHPVAKTIIKYVPLPNRTPQPGTSFLNNYVGESASRTNADFWRARVDHSLTSRQRLFGSFSRRIGEGGETRWNGPLQTVRATRDPGSFGLMLNYDYSLSPTLIFAARAGGNYTATETGQLHPADLSSTEASFDAVTRELLGEGWPRVNAGQVRQLSWPTGSSLNASTSYDFSASVNKLLNRHNLRAGFQHRRYYDNFNNSGSGTFYFNYQGVGQIAGWDAGMNSDLANSYGLAAFMLGLSDRTTVSGGQSRAMNMNYYGAFLQDDFRVTSKLTLSLGLRWDMETPVTERFDKLYVWDADAPAPFQINAGYNFQAALEAGKDTKNAAFKKNNPQYMNAAMVPVPKWVTDGFPKGALRVANSPEYPSRLSGEYYPWQFAPRLGLAYQVGHRTVLRASFGKMYLSTTGSAAAYSGDGLKLSAGANPGWHPSLDGQITMYSTWSQPYLPGQYTPYVRSTAAANYDATSAQSPGGFNREMRMPYEYTWSLGLGHEVWSGFLVEGYYSANLGRDLLGVDLIGRFPKEYFSGGPTGQNRLVLTNIIPSPTAGQTQSNNVVGPNQSLAILTMERPYYGAFSVKGVNIGRSNYHSLNLRAEQRLNRGMAFSANYAFSKSLDDVGGPNFSSTEGLGTFNLGTKRFQSVDNTPDTYGISTLDETHVLRGFYYLELPVGRGRQWLGHPTSLLGSVLDHVVGGWQLSGEAQLRSGRPVVMGVQNINVNNDWRVQITNGSYAPGFASVEDPRFTDPSQVFYSTSDVRPVDGVRRFDPKAVVPAQVFTYGTLPPIFPNLRHPGSVNYNLSLAKAFYLSGDRDAYLQFRMEALNIFNIRGYGNYDSTVGSINFGYITTAGNSPRAIQMAARLVF